MVGKPAWALTSGHVHGVEAGQQDATQLAVTLHLAQPVVAVEVVTEVRPLHVGHNHTVQVPAGVRACVVMLDPGAETDTRTVTGRTETTPLPYQYPNVCSQERFNHFDVVVTLPLQPQCPYLQSGDSLQGG